MQQSSPGTVKLPLVNSVKDKNPNPPAGREITTVIAGREKCLLRSAHLIDSGRLKESTAQRLTARDLLHKGSVGMKPLHEHSAGITIPPRAHGATGSLPGAIAASLGSRSSADTKQSPRSLRNTRALLAD